MSTDSVHTPVVGDALPDRDDDLTPNGSSQK